MSSKPAMPDVGWDILYQDKITLFRDFPLKVSPCLPTTKWCSLPHLNQGWVELSFNAWNSLVQNRPARILTLKQGNKFLGIGVIITSDVIPSSGISRHSRTTPPPLRGQVDKSDLVVRGPFAGTEESTTKSAGITVITGYQADISWTLATTLLFLPRDGDKRWEKF